MNLICGINPVLEALAAGQRHFERLLVVKGLRNSRISEAIARATKLGIPLRFEGRDTLDRMAGGVSHQGLIAVVSAKAALDLETLLSTARQPALVVVLDGVEDPRNLGAILRSAEAAGADGVVLPERHSAGLTETVARASAGALEHVKVARIGNLAQTVEQLKQRGLWVVGFDASGADRWDAVDYKRPLALVLGGEGRGIRRLVRERCDQVASIPLFGHVGSLNVSVAAGVALYEVIRQRGAVPSSVRPIPPRPAGVAPRQVVGPPAGDLEHDPGHVGPRAGATDEGDEGDDLQDAEPLVRLADEDVAWGRSQVQVVEGRIERHRDSRDPGRERGRGRRRRPGQDGRSRGGQAPPSAGQAPAGDKPSRPDQAAESGDARGSRGRRRKRRRGPRPEGGGGQPGPRPLASAGEGGAPASAPEGGGGEAPGGDARRRRRRRRRR
ncbi:MAG: 23S rRNA (guanosine(2251)-2'-O)-methyltransferase RlmB [Vicinamibacteria bacterium]